MQFEKSNDGHNLTLTLDKKLSAVTAEVLEKDLLTNLDGVKNLSIDMSKLDYISSAGLRVLLRAQKIMNEQGKMTLKNAAPEILEIFETTGFDQIMNIIS